MQQGVMRPRDMPSRWVKILPWYYTERNQPTRAAALREALTFEEAADKEVCLYHLDVVHFDHGQADEHLPD